MHNPKKKGEGGGVIASDLVKSEKFFSRKTILSHFMFYAIFNIKKKILKSAPSLTG